MIITCRPTLYSCEQSRPQSINTHTYILCFFSHVQYLKLIPYCTHMLLLHQFSCMLMKSGGKMAYNEFSKQLYLFTYLLSFLAPNITRPYNRVHSSL